MDAIAISAKEQSVGLLQVNTAVNEMDQVTQKNAAMVEEANAASASLAIESSRLRDLISAFQIPVTSNAVSPQSHRGNVTVFPASRRVSSAGGGTAE